MGKVICYGEPMEERCYDGTSTISGDIFSIALGVQRLYPVIASALCGSLRKVEVHLLTALGCDARGDAVLRACEKNGIETGLIARKADKKTAAYESPQPDAVHEAKFRLVYHDRPDAAVRHLFEDNDETVQRFVAEADRHTIFVTSGISITRPLNDRMFNNMLQAIREAKAKGATIVFNTELRLRLFDHDAKLARKRLKAMFKCADIVFSSWPEDSAVFPWRNADQVRKKLLKSGPHTVIVSGGADDIALQTKTMHRPLFVPTLPVTDPRGLVDPSGGGVALIASTVAGMALGLHPEDALCAAVLAARNMMSVPGSVLEPDNLPRPQEYRYLWGMEPAPGAGSGAPQVTA